MVKLLGLWIAQPSSKIIFMPYLTLNSILMLFIFSIEIKNAILTTS